MKIVLSCFIALISSGLLGQQMDLRVSYGRFFSSENESVLETYFAFKGSSLTLKKNKNNTRTAGIDVRVTLYHNENIEGMETVRISVPENATDNELDMYFTHTQRLGVDPKTYEVHISVSDMNNDDEKYDFNFTADLEGPDHIGFSDVNILSDYSPREDGKGFNLIPLLPRRDFFFGKSAERINFYAELYDRSTNEDTIRPFMIKYYIEDAQTQEPMTSLAGFKRIKEAGNTVPMLSSFNIRSLPTGAYFLVLEAISQQNKVVDARHVYFLRENPDDETPEYFEDSSLDDLAGTFVDTDVNMDSIELFVDFLTPIADFREQRTIDNLVAEGNKDKLRRFFYSFWSSKYPSNPGDKWEEYYAEVRYVNKKYNMRVLPGYQSDRGRVYLQYGEPTLVEDRKFETGTYPFEIWQYNQLKSASTRDQTDRIFVFVDREINTNRYRLVHSNADGERYNENWPRELEPGMQVGERYQDEFSRDRQNQLNRRGNFGSRATDNLIINPSSMGRYGRW
jgi:GWxTD domain-containing protein